MAPITKFEPIDKKLLVEMQQRCLDNFLDFVYHSGLKPRDFFAGMHHVYMTSPDRIRTGRVLISKASVGNKVDFVANVEVDIRGATYVRIYHHKKGTRLDTAQNWEVWTL